MLWRQLEVWDACGPCQRGANLSLPNIIRPTLSTSVRHLKRKMLSLEVLMPTKYCWGAESLFLKTSICTRKKVVCSYGKKQFLSCIEWRHAMWYVCHITFAICCVLIKTRVDWVQNFEWDHSACSDGQADIQALEQRPCLLTWTQPLEGM